MLFKISILILVFYFGGVAISFSDKVTDSQIKTDDAVSFALGLENSDSDFVELEAMDELMSSLLSQYNIQGASVALCRKDKLVFSKGFGYANYESGEKVRPDHLFRLASVSKLITAVAVMKLFEQGKLSLDDYVFGPEGILPYIKFPEYADVRIEKIRVRHLLNHTAGWSSHIGDPMFNTLYIARKYKTELPASLDLIIRYALGHTLDYEPGTVYSYSNLGYSILGEIIGIKSGMPYEDYVVLNILKPFDIHDFHIGKSFYHQKFPNEVRYYEPDNNQKTYAFDGSGVRVPNSYGGNNIEMLGAAGGWIASAPELAKFLLALDPSSSNNGILKKETLNMMTDPNIAGKGLFGWRGSDNTGTSWRTGTLSGSTALIMRQSNGVTWVVLLNSSTSKSVAIHYNIAATMYAAQRMIKSWPDVNLFEMDLMASN